MKVLGWRENISEHLTDALNGRNEGIYFFTCVVEGEGGADGTFDAESAHEGFGTVVTGANGDTESVEQGAKVEVVNALNVEGDDPFPTSPVRGGKSIDNKTFDGLELLEGIGGEVTFVGMNLIHTNGTDVVESDGKGVGAYVVGGSCLKLVGEVVVGGALECDVFNHFTSTLIGRHLLKIFFLAVEDTNAGWSEDFMPAESEEVAVESLHVHGEMGRRLGSIDEYGDVVAMGFSDDVGDRIHRAKNVADVGDADKACMFVEQVAIGIEVEGTIVVHGDDTESHVLTFAEHLPGYDVAVVFHHRDNDFITSMAEGFTKGKCK